MIGEALQSLHRVAPGSNENLANVQQTFISVVSIAIAMQYERMELLTSKMLLLKTFTSMEFLLKSFLRSDQVDQLVNIVDGYIEEIGTFELEPLAPVKPKPSNPLSANEKEILNILDRTS